LRRHLLSFPTRRSSDLVGIAAVKGAYRGRVEVLDAVPPEHFRMKVEGQGTGGFLRGEGTLNLVAEGAGTLLQYSGDAQVGGEVRSEEHTSELQSPDHLV